MTFVSAKGPNLSRLSGAAAISSEAARWGVVALAAVLPFKEHTKSLEEILTFAPAAILLLVAAGQRWWGIQGGRVRAGGVPRGGGFRTVDAETSGLEREEALTPLGALPRITVGPLAWPIGLIVLTALISTACGMAAGFSLHEIRVQLLVFVLIYLIVLNWVDDDRWRRRAFWGLFAAGVAAATYGLIGYYEGWGMLVGRALGPLKSYSRSAMYFILWTPLPTAALVYGGWRSWRVRSILVAGILLAWWFALLTQTRGAIGVILLATLVLAGARYRKWVPVLLAACLIPAVSIPSVRSRLAGSAHDLSNPDALLSQRLSLWRVGMRAAAEHPLVGIGYGSDIFKQKEVQQVYRMENYKKQSDTHEFYLQVASEGGLPHLAGFLAFFGGFVYIAARALPRFRAGDDINRAILAGSLAAVAAMLVYGLVGHFHETRVAMMMWYLIALGCGAAKHGELQPAAGNRLSSLGPAGAAVGGFAGGQSRPHL